jgi:hypothetical protein
MTASAILDVQSRGEHMTQTTKELKRAIKAAETARNQGDCTVTYDALCDMRSDLTMMLTVQSSEAMSSEREAAWWAQRQEQVRKAWSA